MRKIREILRLKFECRCSNQLIGLSVGVSSSTVSECLRRTATAKLAWPLPNDLDDAQFKALVYPPIAKQASREKSIVDCQYIHQQLKRKAVTLMLLWQE